MSRRIESMSSMPDFERPGVRTLAIAIPLYIYPAPGCWEPLFEIMAENPSVEFYAIVNPGNGPGGAVPDANYIDQVARLKSFPNATLFGYVHVSWGKRALDVVLGDISTWAAWARYPDADIRVDGIFVDEAPADMAMVRYMGDVYRHVKAAFGDGPAPVWTNPGVRVHDAFYASADLVNSHENTHAGWVAGGSAAVSVHPKSTAMIHSYSGSPAQLRTDAASLSRAGYRAALITTSNCYTSFSSSFRDLTKALTSQKAGST